MAQHDLILRIQSAFPRIYHRCHRDHRQASLTPRDSSILAHLDRQTPITQTELARHLGIAKSTMSEALRYLVGEGYVSQEEADRTNLLRLTDKGREAMSANSVLETAALSELLGVLTDAEQLKAVEGLELLAKAGVRHRDAVSDPGVFKESDK